jgi:hypothetical protein
MKTGSGDLHRLRWPLAGAALALIAAGTLIALSWLAVNRAALVHANLSTQSREIRQRLDRFQAEETELRDRHERYLRMVEQGLTKAEDRREWQTAVERVRRTVHPNELRYSMAPQRPVETDLLPAGTESGATRVMASAIRLHVEPLHEGDLFDLLADLRRSVGGRLLMRQCSMTRLPAPEPPMPQAAPRPALQADCMIDWVTIADKAP